MSPNEDALSAPKARTYRLPPYRRELLLLLGIVIVAGLSFGLPYFDTPHHGLIFGKEAPDPCAKLEQPPTGIYRMYGEGRLHSLPLTLTVDSNANYFVVLEDARGGAPVESIFVHAGETVYARVPFGTFVLRYATGRFWCGADRLFGEDTTIGETDRPLSFEQTGHAVSLVATPNGNLGTRTISRARFWHG